MQLGKQKELAKFQPFFDNANFLNPIDVTLIIFNQLENDLSEIV